MDGGGKHRDELTVNTVNALTIPFYVPPRGFPEERITSIGIKAFVEPKQQGQRVAH
jgi:hypothetical protein